MIDLWTQHIIPCFCDISILERQWGERKREPASSLLPQPQSSVLLCPLLAFSSSLSLPAISWWAPLGSGSHPKQDAYKKHLAEAIVGWAASLSLAVGAFSSALCWGSSPKTSYMFPKCIPLLNLECGTSFSAQLMLLHILASDLVLFACAQDTPFLPQATVSPMFLVTPLISYEGPHSSLLLFGTGLLSWQSFYWLSERQKFCRNEEKKLRNHVPILSPSLTNELFPKGDQQQ